MSGKRIAYVRVSSIEQNLNRQLDAIGKVDRIFKEKMSGKNINGRPVLQTCLDYLRDGDTLVVGSIDRLARSLIDLRNIVSSLLERAVSVVFIKEGLRFTAGENDAMATLMLNMMGSFAEFERELIRERQSAGIKAAKSRGVVFGRKHKLSPEQCREIALRASQGENKSAMAAEFGVGRQAVYHAIKRAA